MTAPSTLPPARLYTTWGTVLYVDDASGQLRHGAIETSPANAVFVADPTSTEERRRGWMMHQGFDPIACGALSCRAVSHANGADPPPVSTLLELVPLERGLIALRAGGVFLCAQPDGRLDLVNPVCSTWECFLASEDWCRGPSRVDGMPVHHRAAPPRPTLVTAGPRICRMEQSIAKGLPNLSLMLVCGSKLTRHQRPQRY